MSMEYAQQYSIIYYLKVYRKENICNYTLWLINQMASAQLVL